MGNIKKFEEILAWQAGRQLTRQIYAITQKPKFAADRRLVSQIQAAAISITSNIAEGFERSSAAEFHKFLFMAKGSCAEVRSQLYNAMDVGYLSEAEFQALLERAECISRLIGALRLSVKDRIRH